MATYNKITPEIAEQLKAVVGERRFFMGEDIDPNYSHDEMPIYGKYLPDA
jgi:glycolate oxidase